MIANVELIKLSVPAPIFRLIKIQYFEIALSILLKKWTRRLKALISEIISMLNVLKNCTKCFKELNVFFIQFNKNSAFLSLWLGQLCYCLRA